MNLNKIPTKNGYQYIGISERRGSSIVINEYKNKQNETRFSVPISDCVFYELPHVISFLVKQGY